jgi:exonuclease VII small subunit
MKTVPAVISDGKNKVSIKATNKRDKKHNKKVTKLNKKLKRIDKIVGRVEKQIVKLHQALQSLRLVQHAIEKNLAEKQAA